MRNKFILWICCTGLFFFTSCATQQNTNADPSSMPDIITTETTQVAGEPTAEPNTIPYETIKLTEYVVDLEIEPQTRNVVGVEKISYQNNTGLELNRLYLNVYLNAFGRDIEQKPYLSEFENKIFQYGRNYGYMNIHSVAVDKEEAVFTLTDTVLQIQLTEGLLPAETTDITIQFEATVPKINHRTGANDHAMWCGNFLPILAVHDALGWHTDPYYPSGDPFYSEIANYTVNIKTPQGYTVAATGEKMETLTDTGKTTTFTAKTVRDFAFALSAEYQESHLQTDSGVDITFYHYSDGLAIDKYLDIADESLRYYSETIGKYPYEQFSIAEIGFFLAGGMEYPQITFMDSDYLKEDRALRSLAHEIGHQWFYNIIGNNQIKEAWLDEGVTLCVQEDIFYNEESLRTRMELDYQNLKSSLGDIEPKSLQQDLSVYAKWSDYYNIQYKKGKLMVYSLRQKMGKETFYTFLKEYYTKYSFGIANTAYFIETAEAVSGLDLESFFEEWLQGFHLPPLE